MSRRDTSPAASTASTREKVWEKVGAIRRALDKHVDGKKVSSAERRVTDLLVRDLRGGRTAPDGYPRGSGMDGGSGSGPTIKVPDEFGRTDLVPVTTVEAAAIALTVQGRPQRDGVHIRAKQAWRLVQEMAELGERLEAILDAQDDEDGEARPPEPCELCARADRDAPMVSFTRVGGRLADALCLCLWHIKWISAHDGQVPTDDQVRRHHDRRRAMGPAR